MDRSRIGPFALEESLAPDRSGAVFRGFHVRERATAAVRIFPAPLVASSTTARKEFADSFETLKKLRHANVVRCFGGAFDGMDGYLATELVQGESLQEQLERRGQLTWETVVDYGTQIASALEYVHDQGVIHGALCPEKILITEDGKIKVADFRDRCLRSVKYDQTAAPSMDRLSYKAPEQLAPGGQPTVKADLYALGCVMYRMLVGRLPFEAQDAAELRNVKSQQQAVHASAEVLDCPVWLDALVVSLMAAEPLQRPHTASAVVMALAEVRQKVAAGTAVVQHATGGFSPLQVDVDKKEARRLLGEKKKSRPRTEAAAVFEQPWFLAVALAVVVACICLFIFRPVNDDRLMERAEKLMAANNPVQWRRAQKEHLEPLIEKYPDSPHIDKAREYIDMIEMDRAERVMKRRAQLGREPSSEGERLLGEAMEYERFGDRTTALKKYESIVSFLDDDGEDRPFVNLARRQIKKLKETAGEDDRAKLISDRMQRAEDLVEQGKIKEAREVWQSIVTLYDAIPELSEHVAEARRLLEEDP